MKIVKIKFLVASLCFVGVLHAQMPNCFLNDFTPKAAPILLSQLAIKPTGTPTATVTVSNDTLSKISKYVFGNAIAAWMGNNTTSATFVKNTQVLNPSLIRFPGGSWSNNFFWNGRPNDIPDSIYDGTTGKKMSFYSISGKNEWSTTTDNYYKLRQQTGSQGLITINYGYARYGLGSNPVARAAHLAADWVRYDKGRTKFWEIGNENPGPWESGWMIDTSVNKDGQPKIITGQLYGQHFRVFADSMRAAAAEVKATIYIGALVLHYDGSTSWNSVDRTWNSGVFAEIGDAADFYVMHNYFGGARTVDNVLSVATTEPKKNINFIQQDIVNKKAFAKPVALTEYNMDGNQTGSAMLHSYINGIQATVLFNEFIKNKYGLGARWLLASGDDGMFYQGSNSSLLWQTRPDFYYAYYLQRFTGDHSIAATSNNSNVLSYASKFANGKTGVVIVNKGRAAQTVKIDAKNFPVGSQYYTYTLTGGADNADSSQYVVVNGVKAVGTQWGPRENLEVIPASAYATDNSMLLTAPALSVVFVLVDAPDATSINTPVNDTYAVVNYPNPFTTTTTIRFQTASAELVTLNVFDQAGRKISTLINQKLSSGEHAVDFNAGSLPAGMYYYQLRIGSYTTTRKLMLIK